MAWEKQVAGKGPSEIVRPADLCRVSQRKLDGLADYSFRGTENNSAALVVQCAERKRVLDLPAQYRNLRNPYWKLETEAWGEYLPDFTTLDAAAERNGQQFVENARKQNFKSYESFKYFVQRLSAYRGPIGKIAHEWRVDTATDLKLLQFVEPKLHYVWGLGPFGPNFSFPFQLTLDRRSGRVLNSKPLDESLEPRTAAVWAASMHWAFEPSTIPENPIVNVTVNFRANCDETR